MVIAVCPIPGHSFEQMFKQWTVTFMEGTQWDPFYRLRKSLEEKRIKLIPAGSLQNGGEKCDVILHCSPCQRELLEQYPHMRHLYVACEYAIVYPINRKRSLELLAKYVYDGVLSLNYEAKGDTLFPIFLPHDISLKASSNSLIPWEQKKIACMFATDRFALGKHENYSKRRKFIEYCEKNAPEDFDLFGREWPDKLKVYRGRTDDKLTISQHYRFGICFENTGNADWDLSEKILDAMLAGVVPVYTGVKRIKEWVPENCYVDYDRFPSPKECMDFLKSMSEQEYDQYLMNIRTFLASDEAKKRFSADTAADMIQRACNAVVPKQKRHLWLLDYFKAEQWLYLKLCRFPMIWWNDILWRKGKRRET